MKCRLTDKGTEVVEGISVVGVSVMSMLIVIFIAGWAQLHIFGLNIIPVAAIGSPLEYYMASGTIAIGSMTILFIFVGLMYMAIMVNDGMLKLFVCKKE